MKKLKNIVLVSAFALVGVASAQAAVVPLVITEVDATGSSDGTYNEDWFELTNFGSTAINLTGYKMDDDSDSFSNAVALSSPVTSITPGQSIVFLETTNAVGDVVSKFENTWFGGTGPTSFEIGTYHGSGVGLGSGGDQVNIFDSTGTQVTGVKFGASTTNVSFDNSVARVTNTTTAISTLSVVGVNGAFKSASNNEIGSPGLVPEPSVTMMSLIGLGLLLGLHRIRAQAQRS